MFAWFGQCLPVWKTVCTHEITDLNLVCLLFWTKICTMQMCKCSHSFRVGLLLCSEYVFCSCSSRIADMLLHIYAFIHKYKLGYFNQIWLLVSIQVCINQKVLGSHAIQTFLLMCFVFVFTMLACTFNLCDVVCTWLNHTHSQCQVIWIRSDYCFRPRFMWI